MEPSLEYLEDWEEWNPESGTSFYVHAFAGSLAGAAEHCAMFPFDTIKTYSQAAGATGSFSTIRNLIFNPEFANFEKSSGQTCLANHEKINNVSSNHPNCFTRFSIRPFLRLWRGVSTMLVACVPAHAAYFSVYEKSKVILHANIPNHTPIASAFCGILATLCHDSIMTPMDVIKQRLQLGFHTGIVDCGKNIIKNEGLYGLYRSFPTTLLMNIPYGGVMVATNESVKLFLNPKGEYNVPAFLAAGAVAGGFAAAFTTPLDVVKTRLQTQGLLSTVVENKVNNMPPVVYAANSASSFIKSQKIKVSSSASKVLDRMFCLNINNRFVPSVNYNLAVRFTYSNHNLSHINNIRKYPGKCLVFPYYPPARKGSSTYAKSSNACPCDKSNNTNKSYNFTDRKINTERFQYKGMVETVKKIYSEDGYSGFTRGLRARLMVHIPSVAISWTTYETAKTILVNQL